MNISPITLPETGARLVFDPKDVVTPVGGKDFALSSQGRKRLQDLHWLKASESAMEGQDHLGVDPATYAALEPYSGQTSGLKGIIVRDRLSKRIEWREVVSKSAGQLALDEPWSFTFPMRTSEYAVVGYGRDNTIEGLACGAAWSSRNAKDLADGCVLAGGRAVFVFEKNLRVSATIVRGGSSFLNFVHCRYVDAHVKAWRLPAGYAKESKDFGYAVSTSGASQHVTIRGYAAGCRHGTNSGISSDPLESYNGLLDYNVIDFVAEDMADDSYRQHPVEIAGATYLRCQANRIKRLYGDPGLSAGYQLQGGATLVSCSAIGYSSHAFSDGAGNLTIKAYDFHDLGRLQAT